MSDPRAFDGRRVSTGRAPWLFLIGTAVLGGLISLSAVVAWYRSAPSISRARIAELLQSSTPEAVIVKMGRPRRVRVVRERVGMVYLFDYEYRLAPGGDCIALRVRIVGEAVAASSAACSIASPWRCLHSSRRSVSVEDSVQIVRRVEESGPPVETILDRLGCPYDIGTSRFSGERQFVFTYPYRLRHFMHGDDCAWIVVTSFPDRALVTSYGPRPCARPIDDNDRVVEDND
jgi:hypothetical protein